MAVAEKLVAVSPPAGLKRAGTRYQSKGRWFHGDKVRFHQGRIMPVGGWRNVQTLALANVQISDKARTAHAWRTNSPAASYLAVGGPTKLYTYSAGSLTDITPVGLTTGQTDGSIAGAWGGGTWGSGAWGKGTGPGNVVAADTWQLDNFGEQLVACLTSDGKIYISATPGAVATQVTNSPTQCTGVVVTPERFLVALGASNDPRQIAWASQGTTTTWTPGATNSAGSVLISSKGRLGAGRRMRAQTLVWTDVDLYTMVYVGGTLIYAVQQLADNCGLVAPNAVVTTGDIALWMGYNKFFIYNGAVQEIPCEVLDYVFPNINTLQRSKIVGLAMPQFNEAWWLYPSVASLENDSYVAYNYVENHWTFGTLQRNCGVPEGVFSYPMMLDSSGFLYEHEVGNTMSGASQLPFLESGPIEMSIAYGSATIQTTGDTVYRIERILSDEANLGDVQLTIYTAFNPTDTETSLGPFTLTAPTALRASGRQMRLRFDQVNAVPWRIGTMRAALIPGGARERTSATRTRRRSSTRPISRS